MTQLDVIKKFIASLNEHGFSPDTTSVDSDTELATAILDKAIQSCSQYSGIQDAMDKFLSAASSNDSDAFLSQCGIILGNADVGGITGSDTGISTVAKTSDTTVLETGNLYTAEDNAAQIINTGTNGWIVSATSYADTINAGGEDSINAGAGDDVIVVSGRTASIVTGGNADIVSVSGDDVKAFVIKDYNADKTVVRNADAFNVTISGDTAAYYKNGYESLIGGISTSNTASEGFINDDYEEEINIAARVAIDSIPAEAYPSEKFQASEINALVSSPVAINSADTLNVDLSKVDTVSGYFYKTGNSTTEFSSSSEGDTGLVGKVSSSFDTSWLDVDSDGKLSFTYRGLKVNIKGFRSGSTLTLAITKDNIGNLDAKYQDIIIANLYKWWEKAALDLNKNAIGIDFLTEGVTATEIDLYFETNSDTTLAYVQSSNIGADGKTRHLDLVVNSKYYSSLSEDSDPNGIGNNTALDRTLAHEFNHAILSSNIDYFSQLPMFIKEGMAELVHGIDDERYSTITTLSGNSTSLSKYINLGITTSSQVPDEDGEYPYAGGYMFLRWLAKTASESDRIPLGDITANVNIDNEGIYYVSGKSTIETAVVAAENSDSISVGTLSGDTYTANSAVKQHITDSGSTARTYASIGSNFTVEGGSGNDKITVNGGHSSINGGVGADTINIIGKYNTVDGGAGNDLIKVDGTYNTIYGGKGDDSINSASDYVTIYGGADNDTVVQNKNIDYDYIALGDGDNLFDNVSGRSDNYITYGNTIIGGTGKDTVKIIYAYNYSVDAGAGDNLFSISSGNSNTLIAGNGNDTLRFGYSNNDTYFIDMGDGANDMEIVGTNNTVKSGNGKDTADVNSQNSSIDLGAGDDTASIHGTNNTVNSGAGNDVATIGIYSNLTTSGNSVIMGAGDDNIFLYAYSNGNIADMGEGNDSVLALGNNDTIITGSGKDTIEIQNQYSNSTSFTITDFDENDTLKFVNSISTYTFDTDTKVLSAGNATINLPNVTLAEEKTSAWSVDGTTATYKEISTSKQFNLSSDNKSLTLTSTSESQTLITITGLKEGLSAVDGAIEGITIDGTTVKLTQSVLGTNNVSIEGDYTLAFDDEVDTPESAAAHFENLTYKSASNTAGYTLADDNKSITYTEEVAAKDLFTLTGVKTTDGIKVEGSTVTLTTDNLNGTNVTLINSEGNNYVLAVDNTIHEPQENTEGGWAFTDSVASYTTGGTTEGYTLNDDKTELAYSAASEGSTLVTVSGVTSIDGLTLENTTVKVGSKSLGTANVTISDGYTLALADDVAKSESTPAGWTLNNTTATYKSAGTSEGYELANNEIIYTAASEGSTLVTVSGVTSTDGLTLENTTVKVGSKSLGTATVTISDGYTLAMADDVAKSESTPAGWTLNNTTATYKSAGTSEGYELVNNEIIYTAASEGSTLVTVSGVTSIDGLTLENTTVKVGSKSLGTATVTISDGYTLAMADDVAKSESTPAGWTLNDTTATYKSAGTSEGYELANNEIIYTAASEGISLCKVEGITSTDALNFDSDENILTLDSTLADTVTITNVSENNITVTNGTYNLTLATNDSLIANANWSYQNLTLYIDGETLTNVYGVTNSTKITFSDGVLTLPSGVNVNDSTSDDPSIASENIQSVIVGTTTYNVEDSQLVEFITDIEVKTIQFDGTNIVLLNSSGAKISEDDVNKNLYATINAGVLTLSELGKNENITVENSATSNKIVTDGTFIASLSVNGTINGNGENLTGNDSWLYSGTTLTSTAVTLNNISGINTTSEITFSGNAAILKGAGISYAGVTLISGTMTATNDTVMLNDSAKVNLADNSTINIDNNATVTIDGISLTAINNATATKTSEGLIVSGNVAYDGLTLTTGTMMISKSGVTLNDGSSVICSTEDKSIATANDATVTVNGIEISDADEIYTTSNGVKFANGTYNSITFNGGTTEIDSAGITLRGGVEVTNADENSFVVPTGTVTIDGKTFSATGNVTVTNTANGFTVDDKTLTVTGDNDYTVKASANGIYEADGISSGATVSTSDNMTLNLLTDNQGAFKIGEKTFTISGDNSVIFGVENNSVKKIDSLSGAVYGDFTEAVTVNSDEIHVAGDNTISVTSSVISGVSNGASVKGIGKVSIIQTDEVGSFNFFDAQDFTISGDNSVDFLANNSVVNGVNSLNGKIAIAQNVSRFAVDGTTITLGSVDSQVTLTAENNLLTSVDGLTGSINGLTNQTVAIADSDVTINSATIQINEGNATKLNALLNDGRISTLNGLNANATVETAQNVSVETAEQGAFTFPNATYTISGDNSVIFVTDANSEVENIKNFEGTLKSSAQSVTVNDVSFTTSNTDASIISAGVGISRVEGLVSGDTVSGELDTTTVVMSSAGILNINENNYVLTDDNNGVEITGRRIDGLDNDAALVVGAAGNYTVNNTNLSAKIGDTIIGTSEGSAYIYDPNNVPLDIEKMTDEEIESQAGISTTYSTVETDTTTTAQLIINGGSALNGSMELALDNPDSIIEQTADFSNSTGKKKITLEGGIQNISFNNEGGNVAIIDSGASGKKNVTLGGGGDLIIVKETSAEINIVASRGKDTIVTAGFNVSIEMSNGATKIVPNSGNITLNNYNSGIGAGIQINDAADIKRAISNGNINFGNGQISFGNTTVNFGNENAESTIINLYNNQGVVQKIAYTHSDGGAVDLSGERENLFMLGTGGNSNFMAGSGNDTAVGGAGDYFDLGAGNNYVALQQTNNYSEEGATIAMTATTGRTVVDGFNFSYGDNGDRVRVDISNTKVSYKDGKVTFTTSTGSRIILNGDLSMSADLIDDDNFIGNTTIDDITPITYEQGEYQFGEENLTIASGQVSLACAQ